MKKIILAAAFLFGLAANVHAGFYAGASLLSTDSEFKTAFGNFDADDSSWKGYAGFRVFPHLDIELTYRDLGTHADSTAAGTLRADLEAFDAAARAVLPVGRRVFVFARAGYGRLATDGTLDIGGSITDFDDDEWNLLYGVGLEYRFGGTLGLRAEWEKYDVDESLNSLSAGAFLRF